MQRVAGVLRFAVAWPGVQAAEHLQACMGHPAQQFFARAQTQVFGQVRQDQPAFAACAQVRSQARQKAAQHAAVFVVNRLVEC